MKRLLLLFSIMMVHVCVLLSCASTSAANHAFISIRLVDEITSVEQINLEIENLVVLTTNEGWISLPIEENAHDLVAMKGKLNITLVYGYSLPKDSIQELRLVLGRNCSIKVDDSVHPLDIATVDLKGLKVGINHFFGSNRTYEMVLNFNSAQSVFEHYNGNYSLKPTLELAAINQI